MPEAICRFVDSIAAAPTLRFDFHGNPSATLARTELQRIGTEIGMPPLLRAMGQNMMRDGAFVSSSLFGPRSVRLHVLIEDSSPDKVAATMQALWRELDREQNFLMWQPKGASKPVFLVTYRSGPESVSMTEHAIGQWRVTLDLLAEPFALGLRETLGPFTVNNDPAAGSNGHYFDVSGVIGDVAVPCVLVNTGNHRRGGYLAVRQHGTPSDMASFFALQAESGSAGSDTSNPGGGPDAAMSGTGANNYLRTSFATIQALAPRVTFTLSLTDAAGQALVGSYRVLAVARRSDATSVMKASAALHPPAITNVPGAEVTIPASTSRQVVDLGVFSVDPGVDRVGGFNTARAQLTDIQLSLYASRESGTGTLDWDYALLIPADESLLLTACTKNNPSLTDEMVVDGQSEAVYLTEGGTDAFSSTASVTTPAALFAVSGGFPSLVPNQVNRFFYVISDLQEAPYVVTKGDVGTVSVNYWPRYLHVRPSTT